MKRKIESRLTPRLAHSDIYERVLARIVIYTGAISPDIVTQRLQLKYTEAEMVGRVYQNSYGGARVGKVNLWILSSEGSVSSCDLRDHVDWLLVRLEGASSSLIALQAEDDVRMGIECVRWSVYRESVGVLWPEQMSGLASLNLELAWVFAFDGEDDEKKRDGDE